MEFGAVSRKGRFWFYLLIRAFWKDQPLRFPRLVCRIFVKPDYGYWRMTDGDPFLVRRLHDVGEMTFLRSTAGTDHG